MNQEHSLWTGNKSAYKNKGSGKTHEGIQRERLCDKNHPNEITIRISQM